VPARNGVVDEDLHPAEASLCGSTAHPDGARPADPLRGSRHSRRPPGAPGARFAAPPRNWRPAIAGFSRDDGAALAERDPPAFEATR
jgi:hypothetical protein